MIFLILIIFVLLFIIFPKIIIFPYVFFRTFNNGNKVLFSYLDLMVFFYYSLCISILLANRPYYLGEHAGFGDDLYHYYKIFEWIDSSSIKELFYNFGFITSSTGSAEPLFWSIVKLLTYFTDSAQGVHILLSMLGLFIIFYAGNVWNKQGLLFILLYTNTITFFAFQGSALRSGLAFSFALLGVVVFIKNKNKILPMIAPFIHFSMIPLPFITYAVNLNFQKIRNSFFLSIFTLFSIIVFLFVVYKTQDAGLGAKVYARLNEESLLDVTSIIQFIFESLVTFCLIFYFVSNKVDPYLKKGILLFFTFACFLIFISPTAFSRFYRYEYIFIIIVYSSIIKYSLPFSRFLLIFSMLFWYIFIGFDRYISVFGEDIVEYLNFNIFSLLKGTPF